MSPREQQVVNFVRAQARIGFYPSYEQIAQHLGLASRSGVSRIVASLVRQGVIKKTASGARNLALANPLENVSTQDLEDELNRRRK